MNYSFTGPYAGRLIRMTRLHVRFKAPILGAALALGAGEVSAQSAARDTTPELSKVTITATRTPISVLRVPLAVTIVGRSQLALSRGYGFDDALNLVPGVFAQSRSGNPDARITRSCRTNWPSPRARRGSVTATGKRDSRHTWVSGRLGARAS